MKTIDVKGDGNCGLYALALAAKRAATKAGVARHSDLLALLADISEQSVRPGLSSLQIERIALHLRQQLADALKHSEYYKTERLYSISTFYFQYTKGEREFEEAEAFFGPRACEYLDGLTRQIHALQFPVNHKHFTKPAPSVEDQVICNMQIADFLTRDDFQRDELVQFLTRYSCETITDLYKIAWLYGTARHVFPEKKASIDRIQLVEETVETWFMQRINYLIEKALDKPGITDDLLALATCYDTMKSQGHATPDDAKQLDIAQQLYANYFIHKDWDTLYEYYIDHVKTHQDPLTGHYVYLTADELGVLANEWKVGVRIIKDSDDTHYAVTNHPLAVTLMNQGGNHWLVATEDEKPSAESLKQHVSTTNQAAHPGKIKSKLRLVDTHNKLTLGEQALLFHKSTPDFIITIADEIKTISMELRREQQAEETTKHGIQTGLERKQLPEQHQQERVLIPAKITADDAIGEKEAEFNRLKLAIEVSEQALSSSALLHNASYSESRRLKQYVRYLEQKKLSLLRAKKIEKSEALLIRVKEDQRKARLTFKKIDAEHNAKLKQLAELQQKYRQCEDALHASYPNLLKELTEQQQWLAKKEDQWIELYCLTHHAVVTGFASRANDDDIRGLIIALLQIVHHNYTLCPVGDPETPYPKDWNNEIAAIIRESNLPRYSNKKDSYASILNTINCFYDQHFKMTALGGDLYRLAVENDPNSPSAARLLWQRENHFLTITPTPLLANEPRLSTYYQIHRMLALFMSSPELKLMEAFCDLTLALIFQDKLQTVSDDALSNYYNQEKERLAAISDFSQWTIPWSKLDTNNRYHALLLSIFNLLGQLKAEQTFPIEKQRQFLSQLKASYLTQLQTRLNAERKRRTELYQTVLSDSPMQRLEERLKAEENQLLAMQQAEQLQLQCQNEKKVKLAQLEQEQLKIKQQYETEKLALEASIIQLSEEKETISQRLMGLSEKTEENAAIIKKMNADLEAVKQKQLQLAAQKEAAKVEYQAIPGRCLDARTQLNQAEEDNTKAKNASVLAEERKKEAEASLRALNNIFDYVKAFREATKTNSIDPKALRKQLVKIGHRAGGKSVQFKQCYELVKSIPEFAKLPALTEADLTNPCATVLYHEFYDLLTELIQAPQFATTDRKWGFKGVNVSWREVYDKIKKDVKQQLEGYGLGFNRNQKLIVTNAALLPAAGPTPAQSVYPTKLAQLIGDRIEMNYLRSGHGWVEKSFSGEQARATIDAADLYFDDVFAAFVREIEIVAEHIIIEDNRIHIPGVNLTLHAEGQLALPKNLQIDTSGRHGQSIAPHLAVARAGSRQDYWGNGEAGEDGVDGLHGQNAGHIFLSGKKIIHIDSLRLIARGGNAGNGQKGGDGCPGRDGVPIPSAVAPKIYGGLNARSRTRICRYANDQEKAGNGGSGGAAGLGGELGTAGEILVEEGLEPKIRDLPNAASLRANQVRAENGAKGRSGGDGAGGRAGIVASRGSDHHWWKRHEFAYRLDSRGFYWNAVKDVENLNIWRDANIHGSWQVPKHGYEKTIAGPTSDFHRQVDIESAYLRVEDKPADGEFINGVRVASAPTHAGAVNTKTNQRQAKEKNSNRAITINARSKRQQTIHAIRRDREWTAQQQQFQQEQARLQKILTERTEAVAAFQKVEAKAAAKLRTEKQTVEQLEKQRTQQRKVIEGLNQQASALQQQQEQLETDKTARLAQRHQAAVETAVETSKLVNNQLERQGLQELQAKLTQLTTRFEQIISAQTSVLNQQINADEASLQSQQQQLAEQSRVIIALKEQIEAKKVSLSVSSQSETETVLLTQAIVQESTETKQQADITVEAAQCQVIKRTDGINLKQEKPNARKEPVIHYEPITLAELQQVFLTEPLSVVLKKCLVSIKNIAWCAKHEALPEIKNLWDLLHKLSVKLQNQLITEGATDTCSSELMTLLHQCCFIADEKSKAYLCDHILRDLETNSKKEVLNDLTDMLSGRLAYGVAWPEQIARKNRFYQLFNVTSKSTLASLIKNMPEPFDYTEDEAEGLTALMNALMPEETASESLDPAELFIQYCMVEMASSHARLLAFKKAEKETKLSINLDEFCKDRVAELKEKLKVCQVYQDEVGPSQLAYVLEKFLTRQIQLMMEPASQTPTPTPAEEVTHETSEGTSATEEAPEFQQLHAILKSDKADKTRDIEAALLNIIKIHVDPDILTTTSSPKPVQVNEALEMRMEQLLCPIFRQNALSHDEQQQLGLISALLPLMSEALISTPALAEWNEKLCQLIIRRRGINIDPNCSGVLSILIGQYCKRRLAEISPEPYLAARIMVYVANLSILAQSGDLNVVERLYELKQFLQKDYENDNFKTDLARLIHKHPAEEQLFFMSVPELQFAERIQDKDQMPAVTLLDPEIGKRQLKSNYLQAFFASWLDVSVLKISDDPAFIDSLNLFVTCEDYYKLDKIYVQLRESLLNQQSEQRLINTLDLFYNAKKDFIGAYAVAEHEQHEQEFLNILDSISHQLDKGLQMEQLSPIFIACQDSRDLEKTELLLAGAHVDHAAQTLLIDRINEAKNACLVDKSTLSLNGFLDPCFAGAPGLSFLKTVGDKLFDYHKRHGKLLRGNELDALLTAAQTRFYFQDESFMRMLASNNLEYWSILLNRHELEVQLQLNPTDNDHQLLVDYLIKLQRERGVNLVDQWLDIVQKTAIEPKTILSSTINFVTGVWPFDEKVFNAIKDKAFPAWEASILAVKRDEETDLTPEQLAQEMRLYRLPKEVGEKNPMNACLESLLNPANQWTLEKILAEVKQRYRANFLDAEGKPKDASVIENEVTRLKALPNFLNNQEQDPSQLIELLALMMHAVQVDGKYTKGYPLRDTQLIGLIGFLTGMGNNEKGRLAEIETGEGKSLIAICLAIACALKGERVDVLTSSEVLAERDADKAASLCALFGLSVSNNCDQQALMSDTVRKERYKSQIVYGVTSLFEKDMLMPHFGKKVREEPGSRLIVDEVDYRCVDDAGTTLLLTHCIEDMSSLRELFILIWRLIQSNSFCNPTEETIQAVMAEVNKELTKTNDRILKIPPTLNSFVDQHLKTWVENAYRAKLLKNGEHYSYMPTPDGKTRAVVMDIGTGVEQWNTQWSHGLQQFIQLKHSGVIPDENLRAIFMSNRTFFRHYKQRIFGMTGTLGSETEMNLMDDLYTLNFFKVPRYKARSYHEEEGFVVSDEKEYYELITYDINEKMNPKKVTISEAEKQAAQALVKKNEAALAKNEAKLAKLIEQYKAVEEEKKSLAFEQKKLVALKATAEGQAKYQQYQEKVETCGRNGLTIETAIAKVKKNCDKLNEELANAKQVIAGNIQRAVVIICEYKNAAKGFHKTLKEKFPNNNIIFCDGTNNKDNLPKLLQPGDIVIATNIAGRGTDIDLSEQLKKNGGAHLILGYMPPNIRIENQAFGRVARNGFPGSGRFIVLDPMGRTLETLIQERNAEEKLRLETIKQTTLPRLKLEKKLFKRYVNLQERLQDQLRKEEKSEKFIELQTKSLMDRWAFWLDKHADRLEKAHEDQTKADLLTQFAEFDAQTFVDIKTNTYGLVDTLGELLKLGAHYFLEKKYDEAAKCYDKIIELAPDMSGFAHYYRVLCIFAEGTGDKAKKQEGRRHLKIAIQQMEEQLSCMEGSISIMNAFDQEKLKVPDGLNPDYFTQNLSNEMSIIHAHINAAKAILGYSLTPKHLMGNTFTQEEADLIFKNMIDHIDEQYIKPIRISKKLTVEDGELQYQHTPVIFPDRLAYAAPYIIEKLTEKTTASQSLADRRVDIHLFDDCVLTGSQLINILKDCFVYDRKKKTYTFTADVLATIQAFANETKHPSSLIEQLPLKGKMHPMHFPAVEQMLLRLVAKQGTGFTKKELCVYPALDLDNHSHSFLTNIINSLMTLNVIRPITPRFSLNDEKVVSDPEKELKKLRRFVSEHLDEFFEHAEQLVGHDILKVDFKPTLESIVPLIQSNAAYVRYNDEMYYVDKSKNKCFAIPHHTTSKDKGGTTTEPHPEELLKMAHTKRRFLTFKELDRLQAYFGAYGSPREKYEKAINSFFEEAIGKIKTTPALMVSQDDLNKHFVHGQMPPEILNYTRKACNEMLALKEYVGIWDWNAFACAMAGLAQLMAGVIVTACSFGAAAFIGNTLIGAGISDISFAVQSKINGKFSWAAYGDHKWKSLLISIATAGIGYALKDTAKVAANTVNIFSEQAGRVAGAIAQTVGYHLIEAAGGIVLNVVASTLSKTTMETIFDAFRANFANSIKTDQCYQSIHAELAATMQQYAMLDDGASLIRGIIEELDLQAMLAGDFQTNAMDVMNTATGMLSTHSHLGSDVLGTTMTIIGHVMKGLSGCSAIAGMSTASIRLLQAFSQTLKERLPTLNTTARHPMTDTEAKAFAEAQTDLAVDQIIRQIQSHAEKTMSQFGKMGLDYAVDPLRQMAKTALTKPLELLKSEIKIDEFNQGQRGMEQAQYLTAERKRLEPGKVKTIRAPGEKEQSDLDLTTTLHTAHGGISADKLLAMSGEKELIIIEKDGKFIPVLPHIDQVLSNKLDGSCGLNNVDLKKIATDLGCDIRIMNEKFEQYPDFPETITNLNNQSAGEGKELGWILQDGHYLPAVKENGQWVAVNLNGIEGMPKACGAQTALFHKMLLEQKDIATAKAIAENPEAVRGYLKNLVAAERTDPRVSQAYYNGGAVNPLYGEGSNYNRYIGAWKVAKGFSKGAAAYKCVQTGNLYGAATLGWYAVDDLATGFTQLFSNKEESSLSSKLVKTLTKISVDYKAMEGAKSLIIHQGPQESIYDIYAKIVEKQLIKQGGKLWPYLGRGGRTISTMVINTMLQRPVLKPSELLERAMIVPGLPPLGPPTPKKPPATGPFVPGKPVPSPKFFKERFRNERQRYEQMRPLVRR